MDIGYRQGIGFNHNLGTGPHPGHQPRKIAGGVCLRNAKCSHAFDDTPFSPAS